MKYLFISLFTLFSTLIYAQDTLKKVNYTFQDINKISITGNFKVKIISSNKNEVIAHNLGEDISLDHLEFIKEDNELSIKYKGSFVDEIALDMTIYTNQFFTKIEAHRGVEITTDYINSKMKTLHLFSENGGKILAKNLNVKEINAKISKGGSIQIDGKSNELEAEVAMGGTIGAVRLVVDSIDAKITFGGEIICKPIISLKAKVTSGGTISYQGEPEKLTKKISLGGTIEKL